MKTRKDDVALRAADDITGAMMYAGDQSENYDIKYRLSRDAETEED